MCNTQTDTHIHTCARPECDNRQGTDPHHCPQGTAGFGLPTVLEITSVLSTTAFPAKSNRAVHSPLPHRPASLASLLGLCSTGPPSPCPLPPPASMFAWPTPSPPSGSSQSPDETLPHPPAQTNSPSPRPVSVFPTAPGRTGIVAITS